MERRLKTKPYFYLVLLALIITACGGSSLLWEASYDTENVDIAVDAALDAQGNLYVVGSQRVNPQSSIANYNGLLLKYDPQGELIWQLDIPEITHAHDVMPLNERRILIETTNNWLYGIQGSGSYYLVSATDGTLIQQLSDEATTIWTEATADQERITLLSRYPSSNDVSSDLRQFDMMGNLTNSIALSGTPMQIAAMPNGGLYYLGYDEWQAGLRLYALDENLAMIWASADLTSLHGLCGFFIESNPVSITSDHNNDIIVQCPTHIAKLSAQGELIFTTDYSDLFRDEPDSNPIRLDFELPPTFITVDDNNDIFIATTQANNLIGQIGNLHTGEYYSLIKSDTLVMKFDGITGERVWSDRINGYLQGTPNGVTSDFYYPMALSIVDDRLQVTVRGFRGNYVGAYREEGELVSHCMQYVDLPYPINSCNLDSIANAYARTIYYNVTDGRRSNGETYNDDYPSAALTGSDNTLYLIGDSTWEGIKHFIEINAQGQAMLGESGWWQMRDSESAIYIQKHQL